MLNKAVIVSGLTKQTANLDITQTGPWREYSELGTSDTNPSAWLTTLGIFSKLMRSR